MIHYSIACFSKPRKPINKVGPQTIRWRSERKIWIEKNPPDENGFWYCHYCAQPLVADRNDPRINTGEALFLTIDHIKPRSGNPKLRYKFDNLVPCCNPDNVLKGSMNHIRFLERYYPDKLS